MNPPLVEIGYLQKNHGYKGDIRFQLEVDCISKKQFPDFLWIHQEGKPVPYAVENINWKDDDNGTLRFDDIHDESATSPLRSKTIYCEVSLFNDYFTEKESLSDLEGFEITDQTHGNIGKITGVIENTFHPTLEVLYKNIEILIPYTDEIVLSINKSKQLVSVNCPEGLIDLYLE